MHPDNIRSSLHPESGRALISRLCVFVAALFAASIVAAGENKQDPLRIVLVGDSTVTDDAGWGLGFARFLAEGVECINTAKGGRSSMSFIKEGRWDEALALKADYYLIQFGHNDEPGKPGRSTTLDEYRGYLSRYVDEARAIGAQPVFVTCLVRRQFDKADDHKINSSLAGHVAIMKEVAAAKNVPLVDLHARSKALCEELGRERCHAFSPTKTVDGKSAYDGTHLQGEGGVMFARLVVEELRVVVPALAPVLLAEPRVPSSAVRKADLTVAADGSGTHTTIQAAIDAAPTGRTTPFIILIKPGRYEGHVTVPEDKPYVTLRGEEGPEATIITDRRNLNSYDESGNKLPTPETSTVLVRAANFTAENITFENSTTQDERIQALAIYITGDRAVFRHCRFLGWQDTVRADAPPGEVARQYFEDCYIEGHVDFIYAAGTTVFNRCEIHCRADGWITAASTYETTPHGYVFLDCRVTAAPEATRVYLGRPWRNFAATTFIRTSLPAAIVPEGWENWGRPEAEATVRYEEYASTGPGASPAYRVAWARSLTEDEAATYTIEKVLGGADGWNPRASGLQRDSALAAAVEGISPDTLP